MNQLTTRFVRILFTSAVGTLLPHVALAQDLQPPAYHTHAVAEDVGCAQRTNAQSVTMSVRPVLSVGDRRVLAARGALLLGGTSQAQGACTPAEFAQLRGVALVDALATGGSCLSSLWNFDANVAAVLAPANISQVSTAISNSAADVMGNAGRLQNLCLVLQIAYYHEFFEPTLTYGAAVDAASQSAMVDVANAPELLLETPAMQDLREQWIISVDSVNATHMALGTVQAILDRYLANPAFEGLYGERGLAFNGLSTIARQVSNSNASLGQASPWQGLISASLLGTIDAYALDTAFNSATLPLVQNGMWVHGNLSVLEAATSVHAHQTLSTAYLSSFAQYSAPWLSALTYLDAFYGATLSNGGVIDVDSIRADLIAIVLPSQYDYDRGELSFQTAITASQADDLYDAIQEVEAQFFRKTNYLEPVAGDTNERLRLVIYDSPQDYAQYQPFLFGLPTNNGGIYIEGSGTLFTYDRTPQQSIYSLEELLRHEVVHYLDARYVIEGGFYGAGTLYTGGRIDTYTEGIAEYLVGSRRSERVLPRRNLVAQIANDTSRMSIADVLAASYSSGFGFYRYAGTLFAFLDEERPELQVELFQAMRNNDGAVVDALYADLSADVGLQARFDAYLDARIAEVQTGGGLFAEDVGTVHTPPGLTVNHSSAIRSALESNLSWLHTDFRVWDARFRWEGRIALPVAHLNPGEQRAAFEAEVDQALGAIETQLPHFASAVTSFGDLKSAGPDVQARVYVEGPMPVSTADAIAPTPPVGLAARSGSGTVELVWNRSDESDVAAYSVYRSASAAGPFGRIDTVAVTEESFADTSPLAGGSSWYRVHAFDAAGNESGPSLAVEAEGGSRVLLVNGYFSQTNMAYVNAYAEILSDLGVGFDVWDPFTQGEPTASDLAAYADGAIIWAVGYYDPSSVFQLSATRRSLLKGYLNGGGRLVMSGAFTAVYLDGTELFSDYLHVAGEQFSIDLPQLSPVLGNPLGASSIGLTSTVYTSELTSTAPGQAAYLFDSTSGPGTAQGGGVAVSVVDTSYKTAFLGFPVLDVEAADRSALVDSLLTWLIGPAVKPALGTQFCESFPNGSTGLPALISATGSPSIGTGELSLHADQIGAGTFGIFFYGSDALPGVPTGQGLRCVGGSFARLPVAAADPLGRLSYTLDYGSMPLSGGPLQVAVGSTWNFQAWYRDQGPAGLNFNFSNGLCLEFAP